MAVILASDYPVPARKMQSYDSATVNPNTTMVRGNPGTRPGDAAAPDRHAFHMLQSVDEISYAVGFPYSKGNFIYTSASGAILDLDGTLEAEV